MDRHQRDRIKLMQRMLTLMKPQLMRPFTSEFEALVIGDAETKIASNL